jgi:CRP-like cAMP-binding protein
MTGAIMNHSDTTNAVADQLQIEKSPYILMKEDILIREGDQANYLYYIIDGIVGIYRNIHDKEHLVTCIGAGYLVGELEMVTHGEFFLATVKALSDKVIAYKIFHPDIHKIAQVSELRDALLERLCGDLQYFCNKVVEAENEIAMLREKNTKLEEGLLEYSN